MKTRSPPTVRSTKPDDAYNILNAVIKCYPDMAFSFIGAADSVFASCDLKCYNFIKNV